MDLIQENFQENFEKDFETEVRPLARHWGWVLVAGLLYLALGILALSVPVASTIAATYVTGALLLGAGIVSLIQGIRMREHRGGWQRMLLSAVPIIGGFLMLRFPKAGMLALTVTLAFYLFMEAFSKWALASEIRPHQGAGWMFASAVISFLLGVYIIATMPISALWVPGVILGIDLLMMGIALLAGSYELRRMRQGKELELRQTPEGRKVA